MPKYKCPECGIIAEKMKGWEYNCQRCGQPLIAGEVCKAAIPVPDEPMEIRPEIKHGDMALYLSKHGDGVEVSVLSNYDPGISIFEIIPVTKFEQFVFDQQALLCQIRGGDDKLVRIVQKARELYDVVAALRYPDLPQIVDLHVQERNKILSYIENGPTAGEE